MISSYSGVSMPWRHYENDRSQHNVFSPVGLEHLHSEVVSTRLSSWVLPCGRKQNKTLAPYDSVMIGPLGYNKPEDFLTCVHL